MIHVGWKLGIHVVRQTRKQSSLADLYPSTSFPKDTEKEAINPIHEVTHCFKVDAAVSALPRPKPNYQTVQSWILPSIR